VADVFESALGVIAGADFFTTEVWTWRGLVTDYTVFVIDLASRRVQILGSTPHPEALFMQQTVRTLTMADGGAVHPPHVLICDRDRKWSGDVRRRLEDAGIRVVLIPGRAPNADAHAERPAGRQRSMSRTTTANEITRDSTIALSQARRWSR
jgi:putative transposase